MGLRGKGAKKRSAEPVKFGPHPWEKKGLSRIARVISFIETLPVTAGAHAGRKFILRPWQKAIVRGIYAGGKAGRKVRTTLITLPRKNGKTALAAGLALCHLLGPESEKRGQVFSAAADREQAAIIFREMEAIILGVPWMEARCNIQRFAKVIEDQETGSTYKALSSDAKTKHGLSASFVVYDELAQAPNRELYDVLATSTAARKEPLMVVISTQSSDPNHVMSELVEYGRKVLDGVVADETFLPVIYEAPPDADVWDEKIWHECNPALGDFRSLEEMKQFAAQAKRIPAREAVFRNLYLNQPVDPEQRFIASADWDACAGQVELEPLRGQRCWGGLDLSSTQDLTALVLYFPDSGAVLCWFWAPGDALRDKEHKDKAPYPLWHRQGSLEAFPGRAIDKTSIVRRLAEIASEYDLQGIAYDRWRMADLKKSLADEGIELPMADWGQGYKDMGPAVDELERLILDAKLRHGGHPVLTWCCSNAIVTVDPAGARKIDKGKSIDRVDGMVALAMAVGLHAREPGPKVYDFSGDMVLSA